MENCKSVSTPLEFGKKYEALSKEEKSVDDISNSYRMSELCYSHKST